MSGCHKVLHYYLSIVFFLLISFWKGNLSMEAGRYDMNVHDILLCKFYILGLQYLISILLEGRDE